jgi:hypothetical protein
MRFQEAVDQQFQDRTPIHNYDMPEDTSKVNCLALMDQRWFRAVDPNEVERRRREQIQNPPYHRARIHTRLGMIERYASKFELPKLLKTTDDLNRLLLDLGTTPEDFENAQREIPDTVTEFWDEECAFQEGRKEEIEREWIGRSSYNYDDLLPASPTHIPLESRSPNRLSPPSNRASKGSHKGVLNAQVQKKRSKNYNVSRRKPRKTRATERREPSPQAREEEPAISASLDSASDRGTTLSEKTVPSAPASRGRAGTKTKAADEPRLFGRVRKSTEIQKKLIIKEKNKAIIGGHNLRPQSHRVTK